MRVPPPQMKHALLWISVTLVACGNRDFTELAPAPRSGPSSAEEAVPGLRSAPEFPGCCGWRFRPCPPHRTGRWYLRRRLSHHRSTRA